MKRIIIATVGLIVAATGTLIVCNRRKPVVIELPDYHPPRARRVRRSAGIRLTPADDLGLDSDDEKAYVG